MAPLAITAKMPLLCYIELLFFNWSSTTENCRKKKNYSVLISGMEQYAVTATCSYTEYRENKTSNSLSNIKSVFCLRGGIGEKERLYK